MIINDLQSEVEEEWVDTAPLNSKKLGRIKIQMRPIRRLVFSSVPGEFSLEDDDDEALSSANRTL